MADSVKKIPTLLNSLEKEVGKLQEANLDLNAKVNDLVQNFQHFDNLEEELSTNVIDNLFNTDLTLDNYELIFHLHKYHAVELQPTENEKVRNIRYKDSDGITMAIVQIYTQTNKIKLQTFGNIFPKQEFTSPEDVYNRILISANWANWSTEDGGINQFDGNIETRYKNSDGNVMAAVITKADGKTVDTIVEYQYKNGKKTGMLHTNQYGQSLTIYDSLNDLSQIMCVDIDTDGCIYSVTRGYTEV